MAPSHDDRIHTRIDQLDEKLVKSLDTLSERFGTRIETLDTKIIDKLDDLGGTLHLYDKRLTQVETAQTNCLAERTKEKDNKANAAWRIVAGVIVGLVLSVATALVAYAAAS